MCCLHFTQTMWMAICASTCLLVIPTRKVDRLTIPSHRFLSFLSHSSHTRHVTWMLCSYATHPPATRGCCGSCAALAPCVVIGIPVLPPRRSTRRNQCPHSFWNSIDCPHTPTRHHRMLFWYVCLFASLCLLMIFFHGSEQTQIARADHRILFLSLSALSFCGPSLSDDGSCSVFCF
jgi:hypothetical protein